MSAAWMLGLALAAPDPPGLRIVDVRALSYEAALTVDPSEDGFSGSITLELELLRPKRVLWLNASELEVSEAALVVDGQRQALSVLEGDEHSLGLDLGGRRKGRVEVALDYTGAFDTLGSRGVFRQEQGGHTYVLTQFEAIDARRAFPCIDQPDQRAPWTLSLTVPEGQQAFANEPMVEERSEGGMRTLRFATTPPLPSYLVAFAVGPFTVVELGAAGAKDTPIRALVPQGASERVSWAGQITGPILEQLEARLGIPYPFSKLDLISIPAPVGYSAMEHPGLVTVDQTALLDPETDGPARQQRLARLVAHELAHMWFGNLVTLAWWDDIWLNEAFATWLAADALAELWPDWGVQTLRAASSAGVKVDDGLRSARRIREPIHSHDDIANAFDGITYTKGMAVLDMLRGWQGPETVDAALRAWMEARPYGVSTAEELLAAFDAAARERSGDRPSRALRTFLDQPGLPLVTATLDCEGAPKVTLEQQRFLSDGAPGRERWQVPVCLRYPGEQGVQRQCTLLKKPRQTVTLNTASCPAWLVPNDGGSGYYRSALPNDQLVTLLGNPEAGLSTPERILFFGDAAAQAAAGQGDAGALLARLPELLALELPALTAATVELVASLDDHLVPEDLRPAYQGFVVRSYGPLVQRIGVDPSPGEDEQLRRLRPELIALVGGAGNDPELIVTAQLRVPLWLADPELEPIDRDLLPVLLGLAIREDPRLLEPTWERIRASSDGDLRRALLQGAGWAREPEAVRRNVTALVQEELTLGETGALAFKVFYGRESREPAWQAFVEQLDAFEQALPGPARAYLAYTGAGFCSTDKAQELREVLGPRSKKWLGGKRVLDQVVEEVEVCAASKVRQGPQVREFLEGG